MGTYRWDDQSFSAAGPITDMAFPTLTSDGLMGEILKKFVVAYNLIQIAQTGTAYNDVAPPLVTQTVQVSPGGGAARIVHRATQQLPTAFTALYDVLTTQRVYTAYTSAGDETLGINRETAYGKTTDLFPTNIQYESGIFGSGSGLTFAGEGVWGAHLLALWYHP